MNRKNQVMGMQNGAAQKAYIPKENAASPMVSTKSIFVTAAIAASKRRKVICFDKPSTLVSMDMDKAMLMVLNGELAELLVQIPQ
jgi:hypothetical protein